jgi:hypothetical protein
MNRALKAEIIRRFGAQYPFAAALGIREATVSAVVRGKYVLDDKQRKEWALALETDAEKIFPTGE